MSRINFPRSANGEDGVDGTAEAAPCRGFFDELFLAGGSELVEACAPVVLRRSPGRFEPAAFDQAVERRIERSLIDLEHAARELLDALADSPAVHRFERDGFEDEEVEGPLQDV